MKLIDLTRLLDPKDYERLPEMVRPMSVNIVPRIEYISPSAKGREVMSSIFGIDGDQLPEGEGWGDESMQITMFADHFRTWPQHQVKGVPKDDVSASCPDLVRRHRLHRSVGAYRHEGRSTNFPPLKFQQAPPGFARLI